jgi:O-antigen ligase
MTDRVAWHPPWYAWTAIGLGILALISVRLAWLLRGHWLVVSVSLLIVLVYLLHRLWELPPAVMMCVALVLTIFSGNWSSLGLPGFPFLPDRMLIVGVVLALALRAPGTSGRPAIKVRPVHLLLLLLAFYAMASAVAAGTLGTQSGMFALLDRLGIVPFVVFLLAPVIFSGPHERNMLLVTLVGLGAYLGITAVFESLGPHALVFPHYIVTSDAALGEARASGPFESSVTEGFANFACAVAAVMACSQWRGSHKRYLAAAVAVVCIFGCFLTLERGVWIAAVGGAVVAALCTRGGRRWVIPGALVCALVIGGALVLSPALAGKTASRASYQRSVWDRKNQTSAGLRMIESRPLFGFGWHRFEEDGLSYFRQPADYPMTGYSTPERPLVLHNLYLSTAVELGLVGAVLWLTALLWGVGGAIFSRGSADLRPWKLGLLAIGTFFVIIAFVNPQQQNFTELLLWAWAGVALGAARRSPLRTYPAIQPARA